MLIAAVLHASWNALVKSGGNPWVRMGTAIAVSGICGLALTPILPLPDAASWPYILASVAIHQVYFVTVCLGYRFGDLSQVYPIQRGIAPLLVAVGAYVFIGETLNLQGGIAVTAISLAILSLAGGAGPDRNYRAVLIAFFTGVLIALYTIVDGQGGRLSGNVFAYIAWISALEALPFTVLVLYLTRNTPAQEKRAHIASGVIGGVFAFFAYGMVIWAMAITPLTYVSALRETSVVLAAWIGTRHFGEPFGSRRIAAATFVAIGVVLLQASRTL